MTDSLVRKELFGQVVGKGFLPDVHCPTGSPRESIVKITKAEPGGLDGKGLWRPAALGLRPGYESEAMKRYLEGDFNPKVVPPKTEAPAELVSELLVRGKGDAVKEGQTIAVNYRGVGESISLLYR